MKYAISHRNLAIQRVDRTGQEFANKRSVMIRSPSDVFENYQSFFKDQVRERFVVFWLNSANKVIGFEIISEGILNSARLHIRVKSFVERSYPQAQPSFLHITILPAIQSQVKRIFRSQNKSWNRGKIIGIPVHDHIIFADNNYTSMAERGLM